MQNIQINNEPRINRICIMGMLRRKDIKLTKQRVALASLLFNLPSGHVTAEELHDETKRNELKISLATVYNTLNHFADNGLIKTLQVDNQKTFFDTNTDHHYHYKYKDKLQDIRISDLEIKYNPKSVPEGKKVASIDIVINLRDE
ncbi:MAG: transcriptional repressor [Rhodobiaceae bacterium]|nr:transcriptional repressor [Rhodobiaceae bacterium]|tara:strand:+ start:58535 stop:58969 length:435 start_codon:yes stop_codon:yes gene_type:complete